ncbi:hypothetical protein [Mucilaginibacter sp.]
MKKLLLALLFCTGVFALSAHAQKITVYCTISSNGKVDYGDLKKLLPDSINNKLLVDPKTLYGIKKVNHVILLMSTYGWKLASVVTDVSGGSGTFTSASSSYILSKEIYLDGSAYSLYLNNLIHIETK